MTVDKQPRVHECLERSSPAPSLSLNLLLSSDLNKLEQSQSESCCRNKMVQVTLIHTAPQEWISRESQVLRHCRSIIVC